MTFIFQNLICVCKVYQLHENRNTYEIFYTIFSPQNVAFLTLHATNISLAKIKRFSMPACLYLPLYYFVSLYYYLCLSERCKLLNAWFCIFFTCYNQNTENKLSLYIFISASGYSNTFTITINLCRPFQ